MVGGARFVNQKITFTNKKNDSTFRNEIEFRDTKIT